MILPVSIFNFNKNTFAKNSKAISSTGNIFQTRDSFSKQLSFKGINFQKRMEQLEENEKLRDLMNEDFAFYNAIEKMSKTLKDTEFDQLIRIFSYDKAIEEYIDEKINPLDIKLIATYSENLFKEFEKILNDKPLADFLSLKEIANFIMFDAQDKEFCANLIRENKVSDFENLIVFAIKPEKKNHFFQLISQGCDDKIALSIINIPTENKQEEEENIKNFLNIIMPHLKNQKGIPQAIIEILKDSSITFEELVNYAKSIDFNILEQNSSILPAFSIQHYIQLISYHIKLGEEQFQKEKMEIPDLTSYLKQNYLSANELTNLIIKYPLTRTEIGEIPKIWLENVEDDSKEETISKIYESIEKFRISKNIQDFEEILTKLLKKKINVSRIESGCFGTVYQISIDDINKYCLKLFHLENKEKDLTHGQHAEPQAALFTNNHSNEFIRMYFGKVAPRGINGGFLVTQYFDENTTLDNNPQEIDKYAIISYDTSYGKKNMINGTIIDFGGIIVRKKHKKTPDKL